MNMFSVEGFCRVKPGSQQPSHTVVRDLNVRNKKFSLNTEYLQDNRLQSWPFTPHSGNFDPLALKLLLMSSDLMKPLLLLWT